MCFLENGPWISVKFQTEKDTFKIAAQNLDTKIVFLLFITKFTVRILCILKLEISLQELVIESWNSGFVIPSRWSSWKYPLEVIFRTPHDPTFSAYFWLLIALAVNDMFIWSFLTCLLNLVCNIFSSVSFHYNNYER